MAERSFFTAQARLRRDAGPRDGAPRLGTSRYAHPTASREQAECPRARPRHSSPPSHRATRPDSAASGRHPRARQGRTPGRVTVHTACTAASPLEVMVAFTPTRADLLCSAIGSPALPDRAAWGTFGARGVGVHTAITVMQPARPEPVISTSGAARQDNDGDRSSASTSEPVSTAVGRLGTNLPVADSRREAATR